MASPTKETWTKRNRRDASRMLRRQRRLRLKDDTKATLETIRNLKSGLKGA